MIEVYRTNVDEPRHAAMLLQSLSIHMPEHRINFDLHDCDRILRVEGSYIPHDHIKETLLRHGFDCTPLE